MEIVTPADIDSLANPLYGGVGDPAFFMANNAAGERVEYPVHVIARRGMAEFSGDYSMKTGSDSLRFTFALPSGDYSGPYAINYKGTIYALGDMLIPDNDGFVRVYGR